MYLSFFFFIIQINKFAQSDDKIVNLFRNLVLEMRGKWEQSKYRLCQLSIVPSDKF